MGADAALTGALTSAAPVTGCDLSPGLLTLPGTSAAVGAAAAPVPSSTVAAAGSSDVGAADGGWRGATEAQLREMERAWDEYKVWAPAQLRRCNMSPGCRHAALSSRSVHNSSGIGSKGAADSP